MPILDYNVDWMIYNCFLAFLALVFGFIFLKSNNIVIKILAGFLWILFLPNTIYIFTDLAHLIDQWPLVAMPLRLVLVLQYSILELAGIGMFLIGFLPFEQIVTTVSYFKRRKILMLIIFNLCVAFGMVLGRVERLNSWDLFFNPQNVFSSAIHVLTSFDLLGLMILFSILCNCLYFLCRDRVLYSMRRFFRDLD